MFLEKAPDLWRVGTINEAPCFEIAAASPQIPSKGSAYFCPVYKVSWSIKRTFILPLADCTWTVVE